VLNGDADEHVRGGQQDQRGDTHRAQAALSAVRVVVGSSVAGSRFTSVTAGRTVSCASAARPGLTAGAGTASSAVPAPGHGPWEPSVDPDDLPELVVEVGAAPLDDGCPVGG
jgi:hypothetical protein